MKLTPKFNEKESFSRSIIDLVERDKIGYIDAITEYCDSVGLEVEVAAKLITPFIVSKISEEARKNNLIEKIPVLPIWFMSPIEAGILYNALKLHFNDDKYDFEKYNGT